MTAFTVVVFALALAVIAFEWIHRTKVALAGAGLIVIAGAIDAEHAIEAVDWGTLGLLAGMMLIVALTERTGVFTFIALRLAQLSRGSALRLTFLLTGATGVLSAFLDNLTAILLVVPVTFLIADLLRISAIPLVIAEVIAANVGGTATLIGDPPNILIGTHVDELSFNDFIVNLAPVSVVTLVATIGLVYLVTRRKLAVAPERIESLQRLDPRADMAGKPKVKRSIAVLLGTIVLFFLHQTLHLEPAVVALVGATVMLLVVVDDVDDALRTIDWSTLFFFVGLFVMVGALEERGVVEQVAQWIGDATGESPTGEAMALLWGGAAGSAIVDNIPFTAAMIPVVDELNANDEGFVDTNWWALALGACFGGNATIVAAAANVAASGVAARSGQPISFMRFLAIGLPVTLVSLGIATAYLLVFQL
ncbi:MAG: ArsB/NhaD family transporter [Thermoleophilia bacterium]